MTDEQIIKALECHSNDYSFCMECPFSQREECSCELARNALDLINRQKAEIERLKSPCEMQIEVSKRLETSIKAEAVKEFLRKQEIELANNTDISAVGYQSVIELNIEILKEMGIE